MVGGGYSPPVMVCRDVQGSCHRDTCECDRVFAEDLANQFDNYNEDYEHVNGFDQSSCVGNGRNRGLSNVSMIFIVL